MPAVNIRDLNNAKEDVDHIAEVATSFQPTATDRFGKTKKTVAGVLADGEASISAMLASLGYQPPVPYSAGINLNEPTQTVEHDGQTYAPIIEFLPFTTSGVFESERFRLIQGVASVDLASTAPGKGAAMVGRGVMAVDSIADLLLLPPGERRGDLRYLVKGYHAGSDVGGGEFYWDAASTEDDNGGTVFAVGGVSTGRFIRKCSGALNAQWFGARPGHESSDALEMMAELSATIRVAGYIPAGVYDYSRDITFSWDTFGDGWESSTLNKTAPATITHTRGEFRGIGIYRVARSILPGDTSDGFVMDSSSRKWVDVHSEFHGGDAVVFKSGNLSRIVARGMRSGGRGFYAPYGAGGGNRAVDIWLEVTGNGGNGFEIGTQPGAGVGETPSHWVGTIISQNNGEDGIVLDGLNHRFNLYSENNSGHSMVLQEKLGACELYLMNFSMSSVDDQTTAPEKNNITTTGSSGIRYHSMTSFRGLILNDPAASGRLLLTQTADREYALDALETSSFQTLKVADSLRLRDASGRSYAVAQFALGTLNFGTVAAGATLDRSMTIPLEIASTYGVTASPRFSIAAGVVWSAFINSDTPDTVVVRVANVTDSSISVGSGSWRVSVIQASGVVF